MPTPSDLSRKDRLCIAAMLVVAGAALTPTPARATTLLPDFSTAAFDPAAPIDNIYFPLLPGYQAVLRAEGVDGEGESFSEESRLSYGGAGRVILGVQTTVMRDKAFEDGLLVEDTFDYYAQDTAGNVWYMGEDVTNYVYDDDGNLLETNDSSAWIAGENGALPGYIMPATFAVGDAYYQEFAEADGALDEALIHATGLSMEVGGRPFDSVLAILETTAAEPGARTLKYYAPRVGLIREDEGLDAGLANPELIAELVDPATVPLPGGLPLVLTGLGLFGAAGYRRRRG